MENIDLIRNIAKQEFGITEAYGDFAMLKSLLSNKINELLQSNFDKLIGILYRLDINEVKLRSLLKHNPGHDAALIITDLIIERQIQKVESRKQFRAGDAEIDENEKW